MCPIGGNTGFNIQGERDSLEGKEESKSEGASFLF